MSIPSSVGNIPALSPIQGSPNKTHEPQVQPQGAEGGFNMPDRALTVPENLSSFHGSDTEKNRDLQLVSGRNVVLNYGGHSFDRSNSWGNLSRRSQTFAGLAAAGNKENTAPITGLPAALLAMPPPALCEETLTAPEHNEILAKLKYISVLVDKIIEVARHKAAPLSAIGDTVTAIRKTNPDKQQSDSTTTELDPNSPHHRRLQQLLLYMRCLHILSQTLDLSRAELKAKKLKPSTSVKNSKLLSYFWECQMHFCDSFISEN